MQIRFGASSSQSTYSTTPTQEDYSATPRSKSSTSRQNTSLTLTPADIFKSVANGKTADGTRKDVLGDIGNMTKEQLAEFKKQFAEKFKQK